jgi:hypothetical protein
VGAATVREYGGGDTPGRMGWGQCAKEPIYWLVVVLDEDAKLCFGFEEIGLREAELRPSGGCFGGAGGLRCGNDGALDNTESGGEHGSGVIAGGEKQVCR